MEKKIYQEDDSSDSSESLHDGFNDNRRRIFRRLVIDKRIISIDMLSDVKLSLSIWVNGNFLFYFYDTTRQINTKMNPTKSNHQVPIATLAKLNLAGHSSATAESEKITLIVDDTRFLIDIGSL